MPEEKRNGRNGATGARRAVGACRGRRIRPKGRINTLDRIIQNENFANGARTDLRRRRPSLTATRQQFPFCTYHDSL